MPARDVDSRELLERYLDIADEIFLALDRDQRIIAINRKGQELLGYSEKELLGKKWSEIAIPEDLKEDVNVIFNEIIEKNTDDYEKVEGKVITRDGEIRIISWNNTIFTDKEGIVRYTLSSGRDITKRRESEKRIKESEERFRELFENSPLGIYRTTPEGYVQMANPALIGMLGYDSIDDLRTRDLEEETHYGDKKREWFKSEIEKKGVINGYELVWKKKDGSEIIVNEHARLVRGEDGKPVYYEGTVEDITEKKKAQERLKRNQEELMGILEKLQAGMMIVDRETQEILRVNPKALEMLSAREEDVVGKVCYDYLCPADVGKCPVRDLGQSLDNSERTMLRSDGREITILKTVTEMEYNGREALMESFVEITELKETQRELEVQKAYMERLFEDAPEAIAILDQKDRVNRINKAFTDLFGYTIDDIKGRPINDFVVPDELSKEGKELTSKVAKGKSIYEETVRKKKDGSTVDVSILGTPINIGEDTLAVYGIYRDISKQKKAQRGLEIANIKLKESDRVKNEFISILAHDLGTPISVMSTNIELFKSGAFGELNEVQQNRLEMMEKGADRLLRLRNDTLELSRMDVGTMELEKWDVDLKELIDEVVSDMAPVANKKEQSITNKVSETVKIKCDRAKIRRVLDNYISNAMRYSDNGADISISISVKEKVVQVEVKDQGRGINPDELEKVFHRFYRTGKRVEGSTGLGLSIVDGIIKAHGGRVWAESEGEGKGSSFFFDLPL